MWWWISSQSTRGQALRKRGVHVPRPQCSRCGRKQTRRSSQWHRWERPLRIICVYPFRCEDCKHRFLRLSLHGR